MISDPVMVRQHRGVMLQRRNVLWVMESRREFFTYPFESAKFVAHMQQAFVHSHTLAIVSEGMLNRVGIGMHVCHAC